jgi:hypothetical protein
MPMHHLLKRLRGDVYLREQVAPLQRSVSDLQERVEALVKELAAANDRSAASGPDARPSEPSQHDRPIKSVIAEHYRQRPYLATVLKAYEGWVADWLSMELPWYTGGATRWLDTHLDQSDEVFEYGAGRSTVWWCKVAGSVSTVEASPEWIAYLNFYVAERPELMSKLQMIHVPADWNPDVESGIKRYWGRRRAHLTPDVVDALERKYLEVTPSRPPSVVAFDGSIRALTMAKWALDGRGARGADIVVVDNTEKGRMSSLARAIVPDYVRLDFPYGPGDVVPEGQNGKHVTTIFVSAERMARCTRGEALPLDADLAEHQLSPDYAPEQLSAVLDRFGTRLRAIGILD